MADHLIGADAFISIDGRDVTRLLNTARYSAPMDAIDHTRFRTPGYAREFLAGLTGGAISLGGFQPMTAAVATAEMQAALGVNRNGQDVLVAPAGADLGNLAIFAKSAQTSWRVGDIMSDGVIPLSADFQVTAASPGISAGVVLMTPHGATSVSQAETQVVTLTGASAAGTIQQSTGQTFTITPGATASAVQTAARATGDANYDAVVVTGSSTAYSAGGTGDITPASSAFTLTGTTGSGASALTDNLTAAVDPGVGMPLNSVIRIDLGAAVAITGVTVTGSLNGGGPGTAKIYTNNSGALDGSEAQFGTDVGLLMGTNTSHAKTGTATARYAYLKMTDATWGPGEIKEIDVFGSSGASGGNGAYIFTFPSGVGNVPQMTTASSGFSVATTNEGGSTSAAYNVLTAAVNGVIVTDGAVTTTAGAEAVLHVISATGTGKTLTVKIQRSADGTAWTDLVTFNAMTATGTQRQSVAAGSTIYNRLRAIVPSGGITGEFVACVVFARH